MTFLKPDRSKFECLDLAYRALSAGGTLPAILNAANEVAVELFLQKIIPFNLIPALIRQTIDHVPAKQSPTIEQVVEADGAARRWVYESHGRTAAARIGA